MRLNPADLLRAPPERMETPRSPVTGVRSQSMQRLQVGLFGLGTMVLLIGLANIIGHNAEENTASVVTEAAPPTAAGPVEAPVRDPLADAGVVPDLPADDVEPPPAPLADVPLPQP